LSQQLSEKTVVAKLNIVNTQHVKY